VVAPSSILESSTDAPDDRQLKNLKFQTPLATTKNGFPDTLLAGELDEWGGHCGRGDDYHYHTAPVHLETIVGKGVRSGWIPNLRRNRSRRFACW
ncbi:MAG: hypothetical protein WBH50_06565, partial [Fuerstiella sp.]